MVRLEIIKEVVGFSFKIIGFFWAIFDRFICNKISLSCNGICMQTSICYLLFLFVAIIFIICGYAIITMKPKEKKQIKKKIKKGFKIIGLKVNG